MRVLSKKILVLIPIALGAAGLLYCSDPAPVTPTPEAGVDAAPDVTADAPFDAGPDVFDAGTQCDEKNPCEAGTCCNGHCTDVTKDPRNCGSCGAACTTTQFCNGKACIAAVMKNLCENPKVALILDGLGPDEQGAGKIGAAMDAGCVPSVQVRNVLQNAPGVLDDAGRPLLGVGDTYLATGGGFGQIALRWVEGTKTGPIYGIGDPNSYSFVRSSDNGLLAKVQNVDLTAKHDWFVTYLAPEPQSGTLVFAVYGVLDPGTSAAVYWTTNVLVPNRATYDKQYYLVEWTDSDDAGTPNAPDGNDTFKIVASGP